jgi:hypothetical protein
MSTLTSPKCIRGAVALAVAGWALQDAGAQTFAADICGEQSCATTTGTCKSFFAGKGCTGSEYMGNCTGPWDGGRGVQVATSIPCNSDADCGGSGSGQYCRAAACLEAGCGSPTGGPARTYFTGSGCTGTEISNGSYSGYSCVPWNAASAVCGRRYRSAVSTLSYKDPNGVCTNASQLAFGYFVYRGAVSDKVCTHKDFYTEPGKVWTTKGTDQVTIPVSSYKDSGNDTREGVCTDYASEQTVRGAKVYRARCNREINGQGPYYYRPDGSDFQVGDVLVYRKDKGFIGDILTMVVNNAYPQDLQVFTHSAICTRINASGACIEIAENHANDSARYAGGNHCRSIKKWPMSDLAPGVQRIYPESHQKGGILGIPTASARDAVNSWVAESTLARDYCGRNAGCSWDAQQPANATGCDTGAAEYGCNYLHNEGGCGKAYEFVTKTRYSAGGGALGSYCKAEFKRGTGYGYAIGNYGKETVFAPAYLYNGLPSGGSYTSWAQCSSYAAKPLRPEEGRGQVALSANQIQTIGDLVYAKLYAEAMAEYDKGWLEVLFSCLFGLGNCIDNVEASTNVANDAMDLFLSHLDYDCHSQTGESWKSHYQAQHGISGLTSPQVIYHGIRGDYVGSIPGASWWANQGQSNAFEWHAPGANCTEWVRASEARCGDNVCESRFGEDKLTCPQDCNRLANVGGGTDGYGNNFLANSALVNGSRVTSTPPPADFTQNTSPVGLDCYDGDFKGRCQIGYPPEATTSVTGSCPTGCNFSSMTVGPTQYTTSTATVTVDGDMRFGLKCTPPTSCNWNQSCVTGCQCGLGGVCSPSSGCDCSRNTPQCGDRCDDLPPDAMCPSGRPCSYCMMTSPFVRIGFFCGGCNWNAYQGETCPKRKDCGATCASHAECQSKWCVGGKCVAAGGGSCCPTSCSGVANGTSCTMSGGPACGGECWNGKCSYL